MADDDHMLNGPAPMDVDVEILQDDSEDDSDHNNESDEEEEEAPQDEDGQDEDDDEEEEDDPHPQGEPPPGRIIEGGVAEPRKEGKKIRESREADITLYIQVTERILPEEVDHPILKPGVTVKIGLDKNTKLAAVFSRFIDFCNEQEMEGDHHDKEEAEVSIKQVEFYHSQVLRGTDTAEMAALMKHDTVKVRKERSAEREFQAERQRQQFESDRGYFYELRQLVQGSATQRYCTVVLDCQGTEGLEDEPPGRAPQLQRSTVRCHGAIVAKRCPWLGRKIEMAKLEQASRRSIVSLPEAGSDQQPQRQQDDDEQRRCLSAAEDDDEAERNDSEEDADMEVLNFNGNVNNDREGGPAAPIEIDDDDEEKDLEDDSVGEDSAVDRALENNADRREADRNLVWVALPNYAPRTVKLLLEYLYTNRVVDLGFEAFIQSCKKKHGRKHHEGPVPPYVGKRSWPNGGKPSIPFSVALAGIRLAEEAEQPRLSLMFEVAASQLVSQFNVVDALVLCQTQKETTGNDLSRLRKAAMDVVLRSGAHGVCSRPPFKSALKEQKSALVPTLLLGTMEAVEEGKKKESGGAGKKREWHEIARDHFEIIDRDDMNSREQERRKRRRERGGGLSKDTVESLRSRAKPLKRTANKMGLVWTREGNYDVIRFPQRRHGSPKHSRRDAKRH